MPRALWSGAISFGLVNAPVRMYTAISEHDVHFNLLQAGDAKRIHYRKVADSGHEVPGDEIVKGFEVSDGEYVTLTRYRDRLTAIIERKRKGETITSPEVEERRAAADLLAALEASLGEAVERRKASKPTARRKKPPAGGRATRKAKGP